ncbi:unnamed protein product [Jaminaea pallidilutea]
MSTATPVSATTTPAQSKHKYDAKAGFDTSGASGLYHTARPDYPIPAIQSILSAALESAKGRPLNILEVGSGTGISTRSLLSVAAEQRRANTNGEGGSDEVQIQRYLSVEPSPGMRQDWQKNIVSEFLPSLSSTGLLADADGTDADVAVVDGTFENLSSAVNDGREGAYDLVLIAQAWHWCQDIPRSLDAIARALKPGGQLALIWNMEDQTEQTGARWVKELRGMYEVFEDNTPQYRHRYFATMYDEPALNDQFIAKTPQWFSRELPVTLQGVKERVLSKSYISVLDSAKQQELLSSIDELLDPTKSDDEALQRRWIDREQGTFEYPYKTELLLFERK